MRVADELGAFFRRFVAAALRASAEDLDREVGRGTQSWSRRRLARALERRRVRR